MNIHEAIANAKTKYNNSMIEHLTEYGQSVINKAYELNHTTWGVNGKDDASKYGNRTFNLHDSYVSAVYSYGKIIPSSIRYVGNELSTKSKVDKSTGEINTGRGVAKDLVENFKANSQLAYELVCAAAIWYAGDLEKGKTPSGRKYVVLSNMADNLEQFASKFKKATVVHLNL